MRLLGLAAVLVLLLYPLLVYFGARWLEPKVMGLMVAAVYLLRLIVKVARWWQKALLASGFALLVGLLWWSNDETLLRLLPALINIAMAGFFAYTLWCPPTVPARVAALEYGGQLPAVVERYTTWVTRLWVAFFIVNASIALATALFFSREAWALYNGLIAYLFMGALFGGEFAYRHFIFHKKHAL